jgi:hypothetical protein
LFGARAVREGILDARANPELRVAIVWIPMLDDDERSAAVAESAQFAGRVAAQYWDGKQLLGHEVGASVGAPDWTAWDVYLFYPPGARAEPNREGPEHLPPPDTGLVQTHGVIVATKGKLPPLADQSALPAQFRGRAEVVGAPAALPALLGQVARKLLESRAR